MAVKVKTVVCPLFLPVPAGFLYHLPDKRAKQDFDCQLITANLTQKGHPLRDSPFCLLIHLKLNQPINK